MLHSWSICPIKPSQIQIGTEACQHSSCATSIVYPQSHQVQHPKQTVPAGYIFPTLMAAAAQAPCFGKYQEPIAILCKALQGLRCSTSLLAYILSECWYRMKLAAKSCICSHGDCSLLVYKVGPGRAASPHRVPSAASAAPRTMLPDLRGMLRAICRGRATPAMHEGPPSSAPVPAAATAPGPGPPHAGMVASRAFPTHDRLLGKALMPAMHSVLLGPMHAHAMHRAVHVASTLCRGRWRLLLAMLALGRVGVRPGTPDLALAALLPGGLRVGRAIASGHGAFSVPLILLPPATSIVGRALPASALAAPTPSAPRRLATS